MLAAERGVDYSNPKFGMGTEALGRNASDWLKRNEGRKMSGEVRFIPHSESERRAWKEREVKIGKRPEGYSRYFKKAAK